MSTVDDEARSLHAWDKRVALLEEVAKLRAENAKLREYDGRAEKVMDVMERSVDKLSAKLAAAVKERDELKSSVGKLAATIRAFPDANDAANLAHAREERDALRAEAKRLREVVGAVQALCTETRADSIIGTSPVARLRLIGQVVDAGGRQNGGEMLSAAEARFAEAAASGRQAGKTAAAEALRHALAAAGHAVTVVSAIPAPEPCPFDECHTGPLGRDQLIDHIAREHPDARAGQSVLGGDDPREASA